RIGRNRFTRWVIGIRTLAIPRTKSKPPGMSFTLHRAMIRAATEVPVSALDALDVISNETYEENGYPHEAWTRRRRENPVHRFAPEGVVPFWAVTKHADIVAVSKN